jgi:4-hydroxy-3-polyprenylbenzoate decarboxylase
MACSDLRDFIKSLEKNGELKRISAEVDPELEITEITDRISKTGGPALLFEKPKGCAIPVLINSLGSERRMNLALGVRSIDEVVARIGDLLDFKSPEGLLDKLKMVPKLMDIGRYIPRTVNSGPCQEVICVGDEISLSKLPILKCWPEDGGRFITFPLVFTKDPATGKRNCGVYRMQVFDDRTTGMHWQVHKQGADYYRENLRLGKKMEVAVAIGADPITCFSGTLPLPPGLDEMMFSGFLRESPVEMVRCRTVELEVPASAEIVLEGYVTPGELRREGPFGDHTGYYSLADDYPVFHLTGMTHRKNPIYLTTIVGRPPMEDFHMGKAIERIFLPLMKKQLPEVVDMHMPAQGVFHNLILISIRKAYPGHARKVMSSIWGLGQAMFSKCIVIVDEDVNVQDLSEVAWKVLNHIDPERDIQFTMGPVDALDHASRLPCFGSKMGIDGTRKWPGEGFTREWPDEIRMSEEIRNLVDKRWQTYGLQS